MDADAFIPREGRLWKEVMEILFRNLIRQCEERDYHDAANLHSQLDILKASALDGAARTDKEKKQIQKRDSAKLKKWLQKDYQGFKTQISAAFDSVAPDPQNPAQLEVIVLEEPEDLMPDAGPANFDPDGAINDADLQRFRPNFKPRQTHSKLGINFNVREEGPPLSEDQRLMPSTVEMREAGGQTDIHPFKLTYTELKGISSVINLMTFLVTEAELDTAVGHLVAERKPDEIDEESVTLECLLAEITTRQPFITERASSLLLKLLDTWMPAPLLVPGSAGREKVVDCSSLDVVSSVRKLRLRSGFDVILCSGCYPRLVALPWLSWPEFAEAAAQGAFPVETGVCTIHECGRIAFRQKRLNGLCAMVLAPDNLPNFTFDASRLDELEGFVDRANVDSNDYRCQAAILHTTSGIAAVCRGRRGPWQLLDSAHPREPEAADQVMGKVLMYVYTAL